MNRDNLLFALMGLLIGFVASYFVYETIGEDQPPRLPAGQVAPAVAGVGGAMPGAGGGMPAGPGGGPVTAPMMQQQLEELRALLAENPDQPQGWLRLANMAFDLRRWDVAVEGYENYVQRSEPDPDILSDLAVSLHRVGRTEEALEVFDRAQTMSPDHWQSRYNEVVVLGLDLGRLDEAAEVMAELQRMQPDNPDVERLAEELERRRGAA